MLPPCEAHANQLLCRAAITLKRNWSGHVLPDASESCKVMKQVRTDVPPNFSHQVWDRPHQLLGRLQEAISQQYYPIQAQALPDSPRLQGMCHLLRWTAATGPWRGMHPRPPRPEKDCRQGPAVAREEVWIQSPHTCRPGWGGHGPAWRRSPAAGRAGAFGLGGCSRVPSCCPFELAALCGILCGCIGVPAAAPPAAAWRLQNELPRQDQLCVCAAGQPK